MAYINNGTERSLKVKVYKSVGGNYAQGYPKTYDGQLAFPGYSTLTDTEARQLSDVEFATRLAAFQSYVESVESGVDFDTDIVGYGATRASAACLEITTTTLAPVYAFSIRYGYLPVDACNGTAAIVYSNKSNPGVGDFLYKDPALTQPWNTAAGSSVRFMSPKVHGDQVVGVAIVDTTEYDSGEIMLLTGFSCSGVITPTTSTTTTKAVPAFVNSYTVRSTSTLANICLVSAMTVYSISTQPWAQGTALFLDTGLTNPVPYSYIVLIGDGVVRNLSAGVLGAATGDNCAVI